MISDIIYDQLWYFIYKKKICLEVKQWSYLLALYSLIWMIISYILSMTLFQLCTWNLKWNCLNVFSKCCITRFRKLRCAFKYKYDSTLNIHALVIFITDTLWPRNMLKWKFKKIKDRGNHRQILGINCSRYDSIVSLSIIDILNRNIK